MGYFVKFPISPEDRETFWRQTSDRISFRNYLRSMYTRIHHTRHAHELEEEYKDEFAMWLVLRRMGVK